MKNILFALILLVAANVEAQTKQKPLNVCINQTNGRVTAKARCSRVEKLMSGYSIQENCVKRSATSYGSLATWATLNCNSGEYLLNHGIRTSSVSTVINEIKLEYSGEETIASGVSYFLVGGGANLQGTVEATCCAY